MRKQQGSTGVPLSLFISYAREDEPLCRQLETHLSLLRRQGLIADWHQRKVLPGTDWKQSIDQHLQIASIILLLITPEFLASNYCYGVEMHQALERHAAGEAIVIPILLRPADWESAPFANLQYLPRNGKAITAHSNRDSALAAVAKEIRSLIKMDSSFLYESERAGRILLIPARDLRPEGFKLGDSAAATFPYVTEPIQAAYTTAMQSLQNASTGKSAKRGMLVLGMTNAGKTRLAFETVKTALPNWSVLRWSPDRPHLDTMTLELLHNRDLVVFVDDLQTYISAHTLIPPGFVGEGYTTCRQLLSIAFDDSQARTLRTVLADLRQVARHVVVVATCRSENVEHVQAHLGDLIRELEIISLPLFNTNKEDLEVGKIIALFRAERSEIYTSDWDGTIGSLILGLSVKRDQYLLELIDFRNPAMEVLHAMKLLAATGIMEHTENRLRAICSGVFGLQLFQGKQVIRAWREITGTLIRLGFITVEASKGSTDHMLVIRADAYFDHVVVNYPPLSQYQQRQDLMQLRVVLSSLKDVSGLLTLGQAFSKLTWDLEALATFDGVLQINPSSEKAWFEKGSKLWHLERHNEALEAYDHLLKINPNNTTVWVFKAAMFEIMKKYDEALEMYDRAGATNGDGDDILRGTNINIAAAMGAAKGVLLFRLGRYDEALEALDRTLLLVPYDLGTWEGEGTVLIILKRYDEALATFDHALQIEPDFAAFTSEGFNSNFARLWNKRGVALVYLRRYQEALVSYEHAIALEPNHVEEWIGKGITLAHLGKYKEALVALDQALTFDPNHIAAWKNKASVLFRLGQNLEAQSVLAHVQAIQSEHPEGVGMDEI